MSDEVKDLNEETNNEEVQEIEASMEERFKEISAAYETESIFKRLGKIAKGISKPRSSGEYKEARLEVQRLAAPFIAVVVPVLFIIVLCVMTEMQSRQRERIDVEIAHAQDQEEDLQDEQQEQELDTPPDTEVDFSIDTEVDVAVETPTLTQTPDQAIRPPDPTSVAAIKSPVTMNSVYGETRNAAARLAAMHKYGGDPRTERAVVNALRWLKTQQQPDGHWEGYSGIPAGHGSVHYDPYAQKVTGLVLLTFLAHGEKSGGTSEFGECVARGLDYLIQHADNLDPMGVHALAEAYGFLKNPNLKEGAVRATMVLSDKLVATEWGDTWASAANANKIKPVLLQMVYETMALRSSVLSGIPPKNVEAAFKKLYEGFMIQCDKKNGGFTSDYYGPPQPHRIRITGSWQSIVGIVGLQYLGYGNDPVIEKTMKILDDDWEPPTLGCIDSSCCPVRGNYWATMVFFNGGGKRWQQWNKEMVDVYCKGQTIVKDGYTDNKGVAHEMGYWTCEDLHIGTQPITTTCWVAQQLMVYYRYLPTSSKSAWTVPKVEKDEKKDEDNVNVDVEVDI